MMGDDIEDKIISVWATANVYRLSGFALRNVFNSTVLLSLKYFLNAQKSS